MDSHIFTPHPGVYLPPPLPCSQEKLLLLHMSLHVSSVKIGFITRSQKACCVNSNGRAHDSLLIQYICVFSFCASGSEIIGQ